MQSKVRHMTNHKIDAEIEEMHKSGADILKMHKSGAEILEIHKIGAEIPEIHKIGAEIPEIHKIGAYIQVLMSVCGRTMELRPLPANPRRHLHRVSTRASGASPQFVEGAVVAHARIQINLGKTQVWNRGHTEPRDIEVLRLAARAEDPDAVVWKADVNLPSEAQGVVILGTPLGHPDFVQAHLRSKIDSHRSLLERIPSVLDLQAAWSILLFCASARANFLIRALPPDATQDYAMQNDLSLRRCLSVLLGVDIPGETWNIASLPLSLGGLGLLSAHRSRHAANWASWSDSLEMVENRHPDVAAVMVRSLHDQNVGHHLQGAVEARQTLVDTGFAAPSWEDLARGLRPAITFDDDDPKTPKHG